MSIRTLFEINHDFTHDLDERFLDALRNYLASGSTRCADELERYGLRRVAQRHHSDHFRIPADADGFAPAKESRP